MGAAESDFLEDVGNSFSWNTKADGGGAGQQAAVSPAPQEASRPDRAARVLP